MAEKDKLPHEDLGPEFPEQAEALEIDKSTLIEKLDAEIYKVFKKLEKDIEENPNIGENLEKLMGDAYEEIHDMLPDIPDPLADVVLAELLERILLMSTKETLPDKIQRFILLLRLPNKNQAHLKSNEDYLTQLH